MRALKQVSQMLSVVMNDSMRKPFHIMVAEIIQLWSRDRALSVHYYRNLLYRRDSGDNIFAYVGWRNIWSVYARIEDPLWQYALTNKLLFDLFFSQTDIRLPRLVGFSTRNRFVIGDEVIWVSDREQLLFVFELLARSSPTASIFAKPTGGSCGAGCFVFDLSDSSGICADKGLEVLNNDYVYQEVIVQHPKMAELHRCSVNTLRIDTYRTDRGDL